jgi:hypothetical protein
VRTPCCAVRNTAMWRSLRYTPHPHMPTRLPCLSPVRSTSNTKDQHLFLLLLLRRNHGFRRIQDSWPPGPFRCPVCVCVPVFMCSHACWSTCFVLPPPPPPPPLFCPSLIPFVPHPRVSRNLCFPMSQKHRGRPVCVSISPMPMCLDISIFLCPSPSEHSLKNGI